MGRLKEEINLNNNQKLLILSIFPIICLLISLILGKDLWINYIKILKHPGLLITDFIAIGGFYANLLNIALVSLMNILILYIFKVPINGLVFSAYFVSFGFASFGKTVLNMFPIYLGGLVYSCYEKINFRLIFGVMMFSTGLSPLVSFLIFNKDIFQINSIFAGIFSGIIVGFTMAPLSSHMLKFHEGFNLYNVGFTAGIVGNFFASIIRGKGVEMNKYSLISYEYDFHLKLILTLFFCIFIFIGYVINRYSFRAYSEIMMSSGRLISDYILNVGFGLTLINCGILGLLSLGLSSLLNTPLNGPLVAGIFTVFGFGAMGKHPLNCIPVVIGVFLCGYLNIFELDKFNILLSALFGTTLAPITGVYGVFPGIIAGFIHLFVVNNVGMIHGGINLYNNGFSGGMVAALMIPIIQKFDLNSKFNEYNAK